MNTIINSIIEYHQDGIAYIPIPLWWWKASPDIRSSWATIVPKEFEYKPGTDYTLAGWVRKRI